MAEIPAYNVPLHWNGDAYWAYRDGYEAGYVRGAVEPPKKLVACLYTKEKGNWRFTNIELPNTRPGYTTYQVLNNGPLTIEDVYMIDIREVDSNKVLAFWGSWDSPLKLGPQDTFTLEWRN